MTDSFVCSVCGKTHPGLPTDHGYQLPDEVWAIPEAERSARAQFSDDLCRYGDRYFIRCILLLPFTETEGDFGWGVWVEVAWPVFERYLTLYKADGSAEPRHPGKLANAPPGYDDVRLSAHVLIQFGDRKSRPAVLFPADDRCSLALEQRHGIDGLRFHEILAAIDSGD